MKFSICIITNAGLVGQERRLGYLLNLLGSLPLAGFTQKNSEVIIAGAVPELSNVRVLQLPELAASGRVCALRNRAVKEARGQWVIQCDDDVLFSSNYVAALEQVLSTDADVICARLLNPNGTRYWDWAAFVPGRGQTLVPYEIQDDHIYATGGHAVYRRKVFDQILWPESFRHGENEEHLMAERLRQGGHKFLMCKGATVFLQYHHCDALAAIHGRSQTAIDVPCLDFNLLLNSIKANLQTENSSIPASTHQPHNSLFDKIGYKFSNGGNQKAKSLKISILTCCHRFLQRFQIFIQSICRQQFDLADVEVIVANPHSPDGLSDYLKLLQESHSTPVITEILLDPKYFRNRGFMLQKAFEQAQGEIVIGMDCDLVLPLDFLQRIVETVQANPDRIVGIYRNFLTPNTTALILTGNLDPYANFETLKLEDQEEPNGYRGVLGYCQALTHEAWKRVGYPVEFDEIAKSDVAFNDRLATIQITPLFLRNVVALHLHHERNWTPTLVADELADPAQQPRENATTAVGKRLHELHAL